MNCARQFSQLMDKCGLQVCTLPLYHHGSLPPKSFGSILMVPESSEILKSKKLNGSYSLQTWICGSLSVESFDPIIAKKWIPPTYVHVIRLNQVCHEPVLHWLKVNFQAGKSVFPHFNIVSVCTLPLTITTTISQLYQTYLHMPEFWLTAHLQGFLFSFVFFLQWYIYSCKWTDTTRCLGRSWDRRLLISIN